MVDTGEISIPQQLQLIESRLVTREEVDRLCPQGIRLFFNNDDVDAYCNAILKKCPDKINSFAFDDILGCDDDYDRDRDVRIKLYDLQLNDTGGLPQDITFALNQPYMLTMDIDVADGLTNGEIGQLVHVEKCEITSEILRLWLIFPQNVGDTARSKSSEWAQSLGISNQATAIGIQFATFQVYKSHEGLQEVQVIRKHFPLKAACAMTIDKAEEATFDGIVYTYCKPKTQQLVALSKVIDPEGFFIIADYDRNIFYHGEQKDDSLNNLIIEFEKSKSDVSLQTCDQKMLTKINVAETTLFSFDCQRLSEHAQDFRGNVLKNSDVILLSETCFDNEKRVEVENVVCAVKLKRSGDREADFVIRKNKNKLQRVVTEHIDLYARDTNFISTHCSSVGDMCAAQCTMSNGKNVIIVSMYVLPGKSIKEIQDVLHFALLPYTEGGSKLLDEKYHEIPMIIAGDFNVDFTKDESLPFIHFLKEIFDLDIINNRKASTTSCERTIDAVFARFIDDLSVNLYVSHFNDQRPTVSITDKNFSMEPIVPITDETMSIEEIDV